MKDRLDWDISSSSLIMDAQVVPECNLYCNFLYEFKYDYGNLGKLRERSDRLAASEASRAVQDRAPRSEAQRSAVQTARFHKKLHFLRRIRKMV